MDNQRMYALDHIPMTFLEYICCGNFQFFRMQNFIFMHVFDMRMYWAFCHSTA